MIHRANCCTVLAVLVAAGCQTIPVQRVDISSTYGELRDRDLNVQQVRDYASKLGPAGIPVEEPFDLSNGVSLSEAEAIAHWYNADVRIARMQAERAGALSDTAGRWPDPELGPGAGRKWFDGKLDPSWVGSMSLSVTIPVSGRVGAERSARQAEFEAAVLAVQEAEWKTVRELREAWVHWSEAAEAAKLLGDHLALMGPLAAAARDLSAAGETDPGTARLFSIEVGRKKALKASLDIELVARRARIIRLMGLVPEATAELIPDLSEFSHPEIGALSMEHLAARHPAVVRRRADYDAAEARLRLELRKQYPDITIAPSFSGERDETSFNLGFGLPVPVWNSNRQGIADALGVREIARVEVESAMVSATEDIAVAQSKFAAAKAHRDGLAADVVPDLDKQIQEAQALMRSGELDLGTLFQVLQQAYEVKLEILTALSDEQSAAGIMRQFLALQSSETAKEEK